MRQVRDDDLILFFYGEADADTAEEIRRLLAGSAELRIRYEALCRTLETAREGFPVPERPDSFGAEVWARLQPRLAAQGLEAAGPDTSPPAPLPSPTRPVPGRGENFRTKISSGKFSPKFLPSPGGGWKGDGRGAGGEVPWLRRWTGLAAAALLLLAVGFLAGRFWPAVGGKDTREASLPAAARERILAHTVAAHLERSERLFTDLANARVDGSIDVSAERRWAQDLLSANRLYRQSTLQAGRPRLTSLLNQLEPFLLELSHGPDEIPADDFADFRQRFEEQALLFKMRIVSERLAGQQIL